MAWLSGGECDRLATPRRPSSTAVGPRQHAVDRVLNAIHVGQATPHQASNETWDTLASSRRRSGPQVTASIGWGNKFRGEWSDCDPNARRYSASRLRLRPRHSVGIR